MQINKIQTNPSLAFKASLSTLFVSEKTLNEIVPKLHKKILKGNVAAYLNEYDAVQSGGSSKKMLQLGLYGTGEYKGVFEMPLAKADVNKLAKEYFKLQENLKNAVDKLCGKDTFKQRVKKGVYMQFV